DNRHSSVPMAPPPPDVAALELPTPMKTAAKNLHVLLVFGQIGDFGQIVRGLLILEIIQPVIEKEVRMAGPTDNRSVFRVVISIVVLRHFNRNAFFKVAGILLMEGQWCIFRMPG